MPGVQQLSHNEMPRHATASRLHHYTRVIEPCFLIRRQARRPVVHRGSPEAIYHAVTHLLTKLLAWRDICWSGAQRKLTQGCRNCECGLTLRSENILTWAGTCRHLLLATNSAFSSNMCSDWAYFTESARRGWQKPCVSFTAQQVHSARSVCVSEL